jgi:hypothetical protein
MSWSSEGFQKAEWTFCNELLAYGEVRHLPWARIQFDGPGEEQKYVVPVQRSGSARSAAGSAGFTPYKQYRELMAFRPFPLESDRPLPSGGVVPGPMGVHFFGGV